MNNTTAIRSAWLVAMLVAALPLAVAHGATVWTVDAAGGADFTTIGNALDAASDGDTINVAAGVYHNDITTGYWDSGTWVYTRRIEKSVTINGAQAGVDPLGSSDRGSETILTRSDGLPYPISVPGVTLNGLMIGGPAAGSGGRVIVGDDGDNASIINCIIQNTPSSSSGHGVYVYGGAAGVEIASSTVSNTAWEAISVDGAATITSNVVIDVPNSAGIRLGNNSSVTVTGNTVSNAHYEGIQAFGSATIADNDVSGCYNGVQLRGNGTSFTVTGNNIHDNQYHGIEVPNYTGEVVDSVSVMNNILSGHAYTGIKLGGNTDGANYFINYNNITGNGIYGVESSTTVDVDATYNWWGDAGGPGVGGANAASAHVDYDPWLTHPIPEPASVVLVGLGLAAGMLFLRRSRR